MKSQAYDPEESQIRSLMEKYGITEAEARISCAINTNSAKDFGDVRVVSQPGIKPNPTAGESSTRVVTDRCVTSSEG